MDDTQIINRLKEQLNYTLESLDYPEWIVIALCGSQNYGMSDEHSDIDSKLLLLPSYEQLIFRQQDYAGECNMPNGEHVVYHDVRHYLTFFRKCNINFVEILFTKYYIVNPKYQDLWDKLCNNREIVAKGNIYKLLKACLGNCYSKAKIQEPTGKDCAFMLRMFNFVYRYIEKHESYENALVPDNLDFLMKVRNEEVYSTVKERQLVVSLVLELMEEFEAKENKHRVDEFDSWARYCTDGFVERCMLRYLSRF